MSFGVGVGDFLALLKLANTVRERFKDAPEQFKAISKEVTGLSGLLRDIESSLSQQALTEWQNKSLASLLEGCRDLLVTLGNMVDDNYYLDPSNVHGTRDKSRRVWKRLKWEPDDIQELRSRATLNVALLNAFNGSLISKVTLDTKNGVELLHERQDKREHDEEAQAILNWLTPIDYSLQQNDFISRRQPGTGQWLLNSPEFQSWLQANGQILFCPGIPGAGKTILTSSLIEDLILRFGTDESIGIAYLYCNYNRNFEQKLDDLMLSLLKQLVQGQSHIPDTVKALYNQHKRKQTRPSTQQISKALSSVISSFSKAFIIIDALDECQVKGGCRAMFMSEIFNLQANCGANILATSRPVPEIKENFESATLLEIRASEGDVTQYLDGHMPRLPKFVLRSLELQEKIKATIVNTIDGMFLLAQLHLDSLVDKTTPRAITRALEKLPTGSDALDFAYEEAMKRIQGQDAGFQELALRALLWVTCAKRPLSRRELQHALAVEPGDSELGDDNLQDIEEVVSLCAGLVTIDEESDIIRLVHYTTQEYFQRTQRFWFPDAETEVTIACLTYLSFDEFSSGYPFTEDDDEARLQEIALYKYAAQNWGHHARQASKAVEPLIVDFLESGGKLSACIQALKSSEYYGPYDTQEIIGVHFAASFGLYEAIIALLKNGYHLESKNSCGRSPLSYAAEKGYKPVTQLLLERGAEIESKDVYGQTPLTWAAINGHVAVVKILLEEGAELDTKDEDNHTPLSWAVENGHDIVVSLLLEKGAQLESKDNHGWTPLSWAVESGHEIVVTLLLEKGAQLESKDNHGQTPLSLAVKTEKDVVELLLEKGAELESRDDYGQTPLSRAAELWYERDGMVKLLLDKGANANCKDMLLRTPLWYAASRNHGATVKLLLAASRIGIDSKCSSGETPLSVAARYGWEAVVKLLLEAGAERKTKDKDGETPLSRATRSGYEAIAKLLQS